MAVILGQMAVQLAGIMQDPRHFDNPFIGAAVQQEMSRIFDNPARPGAVPAESQMVGSGALISSGLSAEPARSGLSAMSWSACFRSIR